MIVGVALSVISFILCSNIIMSGNEFTRLLEIQENGSYQVRFFDVSKEQAEQIKEQEKVLNCIWVQEGEVSYADVELKEVDKGLFSNCYEIADMLQLEKEDISFHNDLLATYGYLGILEAIGVTSTQKKMYILLEAFLWGAQGLLSEL